MSNPSSPKSKRELLPPNLVAFLAGIVLALAIGMIFRKWIDRMDSQATAMRALNPESNTDPGKGADLMRLNNKSALPSASVDATQTQTANKKESVAPVAASEPLKPESAAVLFQEETITENAAGEVDYTTWRRQFRSFEELLMERGTKNLSVTMTPPAIVTKRRGWQSPVASSWMLSRKKFLRIFPRVLRMLEWFCTLFHRLTSSFSSLRVLPAILLPKSSRSAAQARRS